MKLSHLLETPIMVPQNQYPLKKDAEHALEQATEHFDELTIEYQESNVTIASASKKDMLFLFVDRQAVGVLVLSNAPQVTEYTGKHTWQVTNVYVSPEYRNQKFGLKLYKHVLFNRNEAFASGAGMTPSSRRIYGSLLRNPSVDVFALLRQPFGEMERQELRRGPDGVTTGDPQIDKKAFFVATTR